jgi:hypothetical protein
MNVSANVISGLSSKLFSSSVATEGASFAATFSFPLGDFGVILTSLSSGCNTSRGIPAMMPWSTFSYEPAIIEMYTGVDLIGAIFRVFEFGAPFCKVVASRFLLTIVIETK